MRVTSSDGKLMVAKKLTVVVEGPYGLPSIDLISGGYSVFLLIAGGIGECTYMLCVTVDYVLNPSGDVHIFLLLPPFPYFFLLFSFICFFYFSFILYYCHKIPTLFEDIVPSVALAPCMRLLHLFRKGNLSEYLTLRHIRG